MRKSTIGFKVLAFLSENKCVYKHAGGNALHLVLHKRMGDSVLHQIVDYGDVDHIICSVVGRSGNPPFPCRFR